MKTPIVFAFLGIGGHRGQWYSGMSDLIFKAENSIGTINVRVWEYTEREKAYRAYKLEYPDRPLVLIWHSNGGPAGRWVLKELYFKSHLTWQAELVCSIDYVPANRLENFYSFVTRRFKDVIIPKDSCKHISNYYQRETKLFNWNTWPQGRKFINEFKDLYPNQKQLDSTHTEIDNDLLVHQEVIATLNHIFLKANYAD